MEALVGLKEGSVSERLPCEQVKGDVESER